jgi:hypothetical protein
MIATLQLCFIVQLFLQQLRTSDMQSDVHSDTVIVAIVILSKNVIQHKFVNSELPRIISPWLDWPNMAVV